MFIGGDSDATVKRVIRHNAGWIAGPTPLKDLTIRVDQMREGAGQNVPLAMCGVPNDPGYWGAVEKLGFGQVALLLPTLPIEESLRLLDDFAAAVDQYRG